MGLTLLSLVAISEVVLYAIHRFSPKRSGLLRLGFHLGFLGYTLATGIIWDLRWQAFGLLACVWALSGVWYLIHGSHPRSSVWSTLTRMLLASITLAPALIFPVYETIATTGSYGVETALYTYTDPNRLETYTQTGENRRVTVQFWVPQGDGPFPLIVFSHGAFGIRTSNESLYLELASHGYVVASIDHTHQALYSVDVQGKRMWINLGYMQEVGAQDAHGAKEESFRLFQAWMQIRKGDIHFVIDTVLAQSQDQEADRVYQIVDPKKIGVMGHSLGGSAALGVGRERSDILAVLALESPFLDDILGVNEDQFVFVQDRYPVPVLNVYSDASWEHLDKWPQYATNAALLSSIEPEVHHAYLQGVGHLTLTDLALASPVLTRLLNGQRSETAAAQALQTINRLALEFFDYYLKGQGEFQSAGVY